MIVESGWGSILPTVIIASLMHGGPAAKSGRLNIGDQIMTVNGTSLVGLPLSTCQSIIKVSSFTSSSSHRTEDSLSGLNLNSANPNLKSVTLSFTHSLVHYSLPRLFSKVHNVGFSERYTCLNSDTLLLSALEAHHHLPLNYKNSFHY